MTFLISGSIHDIEKILVSISEVKDPNNDEMNTVNSTIDLQIKGHTLFSVTSISLAVFRSVSMMKQMFMAYPPLIKSVCTEAH